MLNSKEIKLKAEKKLDKFITDLLVINGVAEYIGVDDDTYNYIKENLIQKFTPIVHDVTFKLPVGGGT